MTSYPITSTCWSISLLLAGALQGAQVNWGNEAFSRNYTSEGRSKPLNEDFTFELGAFVPEFTPTLANTDSWLENWISLDQAFYLTESRSFGSSALVPSDVEAFTPSQSGYIWGFDQLSANASSDTGEWVLYTSESWLWPSADGSGTLPPLNWFTSGATDAIAGQINSADGTFDIVTANVDLLPSTTPASPLASWLHDHFNPSEIADPDVSSLQADPDGDSIPNGLEYAFGLPPTVADAIPWHYEVVSGFSGDRQQLTIEFDRAPRAPIHVQASDDLRQWTSIQILTAGSASPVTVPDPEIVAASASGRFMRLTTTIAP